MTDRPPPGRGYRIGVRLGARLRGRKPPEFRQLDSAIAQSGMPPAAAAAGSPDTGIEDAPEPVAVQPDQLGLGFAGAATVLMIVALFLPEFEPPPSFSSVVNNTMIQNDAWGYIGVAAAIAVSAYNAWKRKRTTSVILVLGVIALIGAVSLGSSDQAQRRLYPIGSNGTPDTSQPGVLADPGVGVYLAGLAGALAAFGGWRLRNRSEPLAHPVADSDVIAATKTCPDCAEPILAEARVCKHCRYRFESSTS